MKNLEISNLLFLGASALAASGCIQIVALKEEAPATVAIDPCAPDARYSLAMATRLGSFGASQADFANNNATWPSISPSGRYLMYSSSATNIISGVTGGQSYLYDLSTGARSIISKTVGGVQSNQGDGGESFYSMSCDGRYVAFASQATNLTADAVSGSYPQMFRKDLQTGEVKMVSVDGSGNIANDFVYNVGAQGSLFSMSGDGRYVAFATDAANLDASAVAPGWSRILRKDLQTGALLPIAAASDGTLGNQFSGEPNITSDGRYVVFFSYSTNLVPESTASMAEIYVKDMNTGVLRLLSQRGGVPANADCGRVTLSGNGKYAVFNSNATNLVAGYTGATTTTLYRVNVSTGVIDVVGPTIGGASSLSGSSSSGALKVYEPTISYDGDVVAWKSNYVFPTATSAEVVAKRMSTGVTNLVTKSTASVIGDGNNFFAKVSPDGKWVAVNGVYNNLVPAGANVNYQVYTLPTGF